MPEAIAKLAFVLISLPPPHEATPMGLLVAEFALINLPLELVIAGKFKAALAVGRVRIVHTAFVAAFRKSQHNLRHFLHF